MPKSHHDTNPGGWIPRADVRLEPKAFEAFSHPADDGGRRTIAIKGTGSPWTEQDTKTIHDLPLALDGVRVSRQDLEDF